MKKLLVCILSLTMMFFSTACGNTEGTSSAGQKTTATERALRQVPRLIRQHNMRMQKHRKRFWWRIFPVREKTTMWVISKRATPISWLT